MPTDCARLLIISPDLFISWEAEENVVACSRVVLLDLVVYYHYLYWAWGSAM